MTDYMSLRNVPPDMYADTSVPPYLITWLPERHDACVIDIGCGHGQLLRSLKKQDYSNLMGIDVTVARPAWLNESNICYASNSNDPLLDSTLSTLPQKADLIFLHHVLEHIPKKDMIYFLKNIKHALSHQGILSINVPNAQSNTGCYWAFEDFTHTFLFTAGSLFYVLKAAGYEYIEFVDIDCTAGSSFLKGCCKKILLAIYKKNLNFWNKVTGSSYHIPSPQIFSYEIKAIAR